MAEKLAIDIDTLPEELRKELLLTDPVNVSTDTRKAMAELKRATVNDVLIFIYTRFGRIRKRVQVARALNDLVKAEKIRRIEKGRYGFIEGAEEADENIAISEPASSKKIEPYCANCGGLFQEGKEPFRFRGEDFCKPQCIKEWRESDID